MDLTYETVYKVIQKKKLTFYKNNKISYFNSLLKKHSFFICFNNRLKIYAGVAQPIFYSSKKYTYETYINKYSLHNKDKYKLYTNLIGETYLPLIEISPKVIHNDDDLDDLLGHEMAHFMEFAINGYEEGRKPFHNELWKKFANMFEVDCTIFKE